MAAIAETPSAQNTFSKSSKKFQLKPKSKNPSKPFSKAKSWHGDYRWKNHKEKKYDKEKKEKKPDEISIAPVIFSGQPVQSSSG